MHWSLPLVGWRPSFEFVLVLGFCGLTQKWNWSIRIFWSFEVMLTHNPYWQAVDSHWTLSVCLSVCLSRADWADFEKGSPKPSGKNTACFSATLSHRCLAWRYIYMTSHTVYIYKVGTQAWLACTVCAYVCVSPLWWWLCSVLVLDWRLTFWIHKKSRRSSYITCLDH